MAEKKTGKKPNILDILFVLVLLLVLVYGLFVYDGGNDTRTVSVDVGFEVTNLEEDMFSGLEEGMDVFDHVQNLEFGVLKDVGVSIHTEQTEDRTKGIFIMAQNPDRFDAIMTVTADAEVSEHNLLVNKTKIKIGERVIIRVGNSAYRGTIVSVDYDEEQYKEVSGDA